MNNANANSGKFIVLDGIDGCGSTTHSRLLSEYFSKKGLGTMVTMEPSELPIGLLLREYLKRPSSPAPTDALLFAADRVEHYFNQILPAMKEGKIVVSDRFIESSIAYQTAQLLEFSKEHESEIKNGRFSGNKEELYDAAIKWIENINQFVPKPDLTLILDIEPKVALSRKYNSESDVDKFENIEFLEDVRSIYLKRAELMNYPVINVDDSLENVRNEIINVIKDKLGAELLIANQ